MIVLQAHSLAKNFGEINIFGGISFHLEQGERVGLVGPNGVGKSTLLRCLTGELMPDSGQVTLAPGTRLGYLAQGAELPEGTTVWETMLLEFDDLLAMKQQIARLEQEIARPEVYNDARALKQVMSGYSSLSTQYEYAGGYTFDSRIKAVLGGLGFPEADLSRPVSSFSGGQKTRLALGRMLLRQPEVLLLDEPTNFLDMAAVEWLESFLQQYPGSVLVVSHDRYFLDQVITRILDLQGGRLVSYPGNYSQFLLQKAKQEATLAKEYARQQATIRRLEEYVRRNHAGQNAKQAKSRENRLQRMERLEKPQHNRWFSFQLTPLAPSADKVITAVGLVAGYNGQPVLNGVNLEVMRGERVALLGSNGSGKTTLLKVLLGILVPASGEVKPGARVRTGYFAQEHETLNRTRTVLEELKAEYPMPDERARSLLGQFRFSGDDVFKLVGQLSGGERSRLLLAKLCLSGANFLVLDEPTNHLDIQAREVLEDVLDEFPGAILFVSHDRYFLNRLADRIVDLQDGGLVEYPGNYDYYRWKKAQQAESSVPGEAAARPSRSKKAVKTTGPSLEQVEDLIQQLEEELSLLTGKLGTPESYTSGEDIQSITTRYEEVSRELARLYTQWEAIVETM